MFVLQGGSLFRIIASMAALVLAFSFGYGFGLSSADPSVWNCAVTGVGGCRNNCV